MINVSNEYININIENIEEFTIDILKFGLKYLEFNHEVIIDVLIIDEDEMYTINLDSRGIDKSTDVLSFPYNDIYENKYDINKLEIDYDTGEILLGDIVINYDRVISQAKDYNHTEEREYGFLLIHSLLHLLGFDHMDDDQEKKMFSIQRKILEEYGLSR